MRHIPGSGPTEIQAGIISDAFHKVKQKLRDIFHKHDQGEVGHKDVHEALKESHHEIEGAKRQKMRGAEKTQFEQAAKKGTGKGRRGKPVFFTVERALHAVGSAAYHEVIYYLNRKTGILPSPPRPVGSSAAQKHEMEVTFKGRTIKIKKKTASDAKRIASRYNQALGNKKQRNLQNRDEGMAKGRDTRRKNIEAIQDRRHDALSDHIKLHAKNSGMAAIKESKHFGKIVKGLAKHLPHDVAHAASDLAEKLVKDPAGFRKHLKETVPNPAERKKIHHFLRRMEKSVRNPGSVSEPSAPGNAERKAASVRWNW